MTARKFNLKKIAGFTLVELLIVIGLLGAIALIVIAAINPIEQANRARDTRFKADSGQLISAIDRYFATRSEFPWVTTGGAANSDASFGFVTAGNDGVGICAVPADCGNDGVLITNDELKPEFRNRDFIDNVGGDPSEQLWMGKVTGTSQSVYSCFIPLSKASRQDAVADSKVFHISALDGSRTATIDCDADTADWVALDCYVCVPE